jgi:hypothetical protein
MHRRVAGATPAGIHSNALDLIERATAATENGHGVES